MNKKGAFGIDQGGRVLWILLICFVAALVIVSFVIAGINKEWFNIERILP